MLAGGIALLALTFALAMYSVPSGIPEIPSFPFFSFPFPLLSLLLVLSVTLMAWGWIFHPIGSLGQLMVGAGVLVVAGVLLKVFSFVTAIPLVLGSMTIYVEPYGAHTTLVLLVGPLLALFGLVFHFAERREWLKRGGEKAFRSP